MGWAYKCPDSGLVDFCDGPGMCSCACGAEHEAFEYGAKAVDMGPHTPFRRYYSIMHGRQLNSWGDYNRAQKELGMREVPQIDSQWIRQGKISSYQGQRRH